MTRITAGGVRDSTFVGAARWLVGTGQPPGRTFQSPIYTSPACSKASRAPSGDQTGEDALAMSGFSSPPTSPSQIVLESSVSLPVGARVKTKRRPPGDSEGVRKYSLSP